MRPSTRRRRSVPSASIRISRAGASRSTSAAWRALSSRQAATGSGRSRNSARRDEGGVVALAHPAPAGRAPASATASRTSAGPAAPPGSGARARAARAISAGIDAGQRAGVGRARRSAARRRPPRSRSARAARSRRAARRGRGGRSPRPAPGGERRSSGQAPRSSSARCSASTGSWASVVVLDQDLLARPGPRGTSRRAARRSASGFASRRLQLGEVLARRARAGVSRTNRRSSAEAIR